MKVEIFGSGGAFTTPRPGCLRRVCTEARERGSYDELHDVGRREGFEFAYDGMVPDV